jgi:hypothetical protein
VRGFYPREQHAVEKFRDDDVSAVVAAERIPSSVIVLEDLTPQLRYPGLKLGF